MNLDALRYHLELTAEQRDRVGEWLTSVFGAGWAALRLWRYEVIGEGVVRFEQYVFDGAAIRLETFERTTATPPPILEGAS